MYESNTHNSNYPIRELSSQLLEMWGIDERLLNKSCFPSNESLKRERKQERKQF